MRKTFIVLSFLLLLPFAAHAQDGSLKMVAPAASLEDPTMDTSAFGIWLDQLLCKSLTLAPGTYKDTMKEAAPHFTKNGWKGYTDALLKSHILDTITTKQQTATPMPCPTTDLFQRGVYDNRYTWEMGANVVFEYSGGTEEIPSEEYTLKVTVVRAPESENPDGLGIEKFQWTKVDVNPIQGVRSHEPIGD